MRRIRMLRLVFKSFGKLYYFPHVIMFIYLPLMAVRYVCLVGLTDQTQSLVCYDFQMLLPVLAVWWAYLILKERLEGEGRELFGIYQSGSRGNAAELLLAWIWYGFHIGVVTAIAAVFFNSMFWVYLQLLSESLFFFGVYVLIAGITANGSVALLFTLVYYFATAFFSSDTVLDYISVFDFSQIASSWSVVTRYIPIAAVGMGAFFLGNQIGYMKSKLH